MLSEREQQHVKRIAKKHRSRAKIVNAESIPARDTDDAYGNPFLGIPSNRLKEFDITDAEQASNSTDSRVLASGDNDSLRAVNTAHMQNQLLAGRHFIGTSSPYRLPAGVKVAAGTDIDGTLDVAQLPANIPAGNVPSLQDLNGSVINSQLPNILKAKLPRDTVFGNRQGKLSYGDLLDLPNLSRFATDSDLKKRTTATKVRQIVRSMVKATSLK